MQQYVAFLRGINVSGKNLIKMEPLKTSLTGTGLLGVKTYLQSGNVIFSHESGDTARLANEITKVIEKDFGLAIPVIVLSVERLREILTESPYFGSDTYNPAGCYITFLAEVTKPIDSESLERKRTDETYLVTPGAVHLYCPGGYGNTKLTNNYIEALAGGTATTRNHRTVTEILKIVN